MTDFLVEYRNIILALHIFGTTLGLGGAIVTDLMFMRFLKDYRVSPEEKGILDNLSMVIWAGIGLLILTGVSLLWPYKTAFLQSPVYQVKLITVAVIFVNGLILNFYVSPKLTSIVFNEPGANPPAVNRVRKLSPIFGGISIISWTYTFFLGSMSSSLDYPFGVLFGIYHA
jgi:uncharacterized membrane protein